MGKRFLIGGDDFAEARKECYLVDKTQFISDFLATRTKVVLFTRPRRFGKTLTLSMMRYFLDIADAEEHRKLFDGLAVSQDKSAMAEFGKRPVVFLTVKDWDAVTWKDMQEMIAFGMQNVFQSFAYLLESSAVDAEDKKLFQMVREGRASLTQLRNSLFLLMRMLDAHHGRPPVLLLDEYDAPLQSAWSHGYDQPARAFFRSFYSLAFKTNPHLDFAILTGVLRIAKESIFSGLNNLRVDSLLSTTYQTVMGFTAAEVEQMATDLGHADKTLELRNWYDGYRFAGHEMYNPWSVLNYFYQDCEPDTYWANTSTNAILGELMKRTDAKHIDALTSLLQGGTLTGFLRDGVIYDDIGEDEDALYTMLLTTGYLTVESERRVGNEKEYTLRLPNREMQALFGIEVLKRYQKGFSKSALVRLLESMLAGDEYRVQAGLSRYLEKVASVFDTAAKESFYHGFVLGIVAALEPDYLVRSNREAGYGRYDVAVLPSTPGWNAMILEFKVADSEDVLEARAQEALAQIDARDYAEALEAARPDKVQRYGIAFCGKRVCVKMGKA